MIVGYSFKGPLEHEFSGKFYQKSSLQLDVHRTCNEMNKKSQMNTCLMK